MCEKDVEPGGKSCEHEAPQKKSCWCEPRCEEMVQASMHGRHLT